jgi:hypothetical protein
MLLEDNPAVPRSICWSDEACSHLNGYVNKQNIHAWATEHSHNLIETPLHPEECTMSCALHKKWYCWEILFDDTVTVDHYLGAPRRIYSVSRRNGCQFRRNNFSIERGSAHSRMQRWVRSMSILTTECCPILILNSADMGGAGHHAVQVLNPCDYFLWRFLKAIA